MGQQIRKKETVLRRYGEGEEAETAGDIVAVILEQIGLTVLASGNGARLE